MMSRIHQKLVLSRGIMVDVETAGPYPTIHALLSIGACVIARPGNRFYVELKPDSNRFDAGALAVCGFDLDMLSKTGIEPKSALMMFVEWVSTQYEEPLFVAHNSPFDWMFTIAYLGKYDVLHGFGHWALDTKSAYGDIMTSPIPHHAGKDAYIQTLDLRRYYGLE